MTSKDSEAQFWNSLWTIRYFFWALVCLLTGSAIGLILQGKAVDAVGQGIALVMVISGNVWLKRIVRREVDRRAKETLGTQFQMEQIEENK